MAKNKEYTCVLVETDDEGITWITFNRPEKRNAMSPTLHVEMEEILFGLKPMKIPKSSCLPAPATAGVPEWTSSSIFARRIKIR